MSKDKKFENEYRDCVFNEVDMDRLNLGESKFIRCNFFSPSDESELKEVGVEPNEEDGQHRFFKSSRHEKEYSPKYKGVEPSEKDKQEDKLKVKHEEEAPKLSRYEFKSTAKDIDLKRIFQENKEDGTKAFIIIIPGGAFVGLQKENLKHLQRSDLNNLGMELGYSERDFYCGNWEDDDYYHVSQKYEEIMSTHPNTIPQPNLSGKVQASNYGFQCKGIRKDEISDAICKISKTLQIAEKKRREKLKIEVLTWR
jgi:hypothetical protein